MSKITIGDLVNDHRDDYRDVNALNALALAFTNAIAIVPRRVVEMTIEYCLQNESYFESVGRGDVAIGLRSAREYTETLLKLFEEDEDEVNH